MTASTIALEKLRPHLKAGETILWSGQPVSYVYMIAKLPWYATYGFLYFCWRLFYAMWASTRSYSLFDNVFPVFVLFIGPVLLFLFSLRWAKDWSYFVTSERIVIFLDRSGKQAQSYRFKWQARDFLASPHLVDQEFIFISLSRVGELRVRRELFFFGQVYFRAFFDPREKEAPIVDVKASLKRTRRQYLDSYAERPFNTADRFMAVRSPYKVAEIILRAAKAEQAEQKSL
jgi:hypothetical protein